MKEKLKWKSNISLTTEKDDRSRQKQIFKDKDKYEMVKVFKIR